MKTLKELKKIHDDYGIIARTLTAAEEAVNRAKNAVNEAKDALKEAKETLNMEEDVLFNEDAAYKDAAEKIKSTEMWKIFNQPIPNTKIQ